MSNQTLQRRKRIDARSFHAATAAGLTQPAGGTKPWHAMGSVQTSTTMKMRIGLFTPDSRKGTAKTTATTYVEIVEIKDLAEKLASLGAKNVGLLCRDRTGATRIEGAMFSPAELKPSHLDWLNAKSAEFETRGLFYDLK
ncbi:MAG TPA: hypothetical protein VHD62_01000 [Opitutaceae bacterium]|nr:hypothetical protein [Opitutaceae bacterium]